MNGLMDYSVGLDSALIPSPAPRTAARQKGARDLLRACEQWEERLENHLLLCFYEQGQLAGALVANLKDRTAWQQPFKGDAGVMGALAAMAISPTEGQLFNFMRLRKIRWN